MNATLHIFRSGRHTAMSGRAVEFSEADVAALAAAYDPTVHEAPIVVGHPATDDPAYGWVGALRAEGGDLFAEPRQIEPQFAEMVRQGRFRKISASFYPPQAASNPRPDGWYLKHVGFLGAQAPAVKGLAPVALEYMARETVTAESPVWLEELLAWLNYLEAQVAQLENQIAALEMGRDTA